MMRCVTALALCATLAVTAHNNTLQLVQVLFRHGARTPVIACPTDPNSEAFITQGLGQLTNEGKRMQFELGQFLRGWYTGFLKEQYHRNYTHVRSSDVDRTLQSAQANLAGLYPPKGANQWNPDLAWQPIPVHTLPESEDRELSFLYSCDRFKQEFKRVLKTDELRRRDAKNKALYDYLSGKCGVAVRDFLTLSFMYDLFLVESRTNRTLPAWATAKLAPYNKPVYPNLLEPENALTFELLSWDDQLKRLGGGILLKSMTDTLQEKVDGVLQPDSRQLMMYSGHDSDIAALLGTLGVYSGTPPTLASCVIVELHKDTSGGFFVKLFYRNDTSAPPYPLRLPKCNLKCPWEAFRDLTASVRPLDAAKECTVPSGTPNHMQTVVIALSTALALLLVICLLAAVAYVRSRRQQLPSYSHFGEIAT